MVNYSIPDYISITLMHALRCIYFKLANISKTLGPGRFPEGKGHFPEGIPEGQLCEHSAVIIKSILIYIYMYIYIYIYIVCVLLLMILWWGPFM